MVQTLLNNVNPPPASHRNWWNNYSASHRSKRLFDKLFSSANDVLSANSPFSLDLVFRTTNKAVFNQQLTWFTFRPGTNQLAIFFPSRPDDGFDRLPVPIHCTSGNDCTNEDQTARRNRALTVQTVVISFGRRHVSTVLALDMFPRDNNFPIKLVFHSEHHSRLQLTRRPDVGREELPIRNPSQLKIPGESLAMEIVKIILFNYVICFVFVQQ